MLRIDVFLTGLILVLASCTQRMICPAYQSSFIFDKETLRKKFSYFKEDSIPKIYTASKNKYLVAVPESYRSRYRKMKTIEMKPVYPVKVDSLSSDSLFVDEMDSAKVAQLDSAVIARGNVIRVEKVDSAYAITKTKEKYNLDQDYYMWIFRKELILPDVRESLRKKKEDKMEVGKEKKKTKKRRLFGRKRKSKQDSTMVVAPVDSLNFDPLPGELPDSSQVEPPPPIPPKKKGFRLFRRKNKSKKMDNTQPSPAKKEENDGF